MKVGNRNAMSNSKIEHVLIVLLLFAASGCNKANSLHIACDLSKTTLAELKTQIL